MPETKPLVELLKIAAAIARREYVPCLEKCRTIRDAREEVNRMSDRHAFLAYQIKLQLDILREGER